MHRPHRTRPSRQVGRHVDRATPHRQPRRAVAQRRGRRRELRTLCLEPPTPVSVVPAAEHMSAVTPGYPFAPGASPLALGLLAMPAMLLARIDLDRPPGVGNTPLGSKADANLPTAHLTRMVRRLHARRRR